VLCSLYAGFPHLFRVLVLTLHIRPLKIFSWGLLGPSSPFQVAEIPQSHTLFLPNVLARSSLAVMLGLQNFFVLCHGQQLFGLLSLYVLDIWRPCLFVWLSWLTFAQPILFWLGLQNCSRILKLQRTVRACCLSLLFMPPARRLYSELY
jgi:hypothetical protein